MGAAAGIFLGIGLLWAVSALAVQARRAGRRGRRPHTAPVGNPGRAVLYNFTIAMLPSHKESVSRHPASFAAGALLHLGVFASLAAVLIGSVSSVIGILAAVGAAACAALILRRGFDRELRAISVPDDFLAAGAVGAFLIVTAACAWVWLPVHAVRVAAGLLLFYMPLGKLRHAVFFFLARAELGRRLGWRGVYPPPVQAGTGD